MNEYKSEGDNFSTQGPECYLEAAIMYFELSLSAQGIVPLNPLMDCKKRGQIEGSVCRGGDAIP